MQEEKVRFLTEKFNGKITSNDALKLSDKMLKAKDEAFAVLNGLTLKNKVAALLLSIFLGGFCAGRFYLGDYKFAIFKIITTVVIVVIATLLSFIPVLGLLLAVAASIGTFAWYIVEIIKCYKLAQEMNFENIYNVLDVYSVK